MIALQSSIDCTGLAAPHYICIIVLTDKCGTVVHDSYPPHCSIGCIWLWACGPGLV